MTDAAAIDRLRAIAVRLTEREDPDAPWFAACLAEYEAGARHGLGLDDAFGLRPRMGESGWWLLEARTARDALLRAIAANYFGGQSARSAADAIAKKVARYESGDWRHHRKFTARPTMHGIRADLFRLLKTGAPVSASTVRRALAHEPPLPVSHGPEQAAPATEDSHASHSDETEAPARSCRSAAAAPGS